MTTLRDLTPEQTRRYRATALRRQAETRAAVARRKEFGASRVVVFGSLAREEGFNRWSDVDIAAWGVAPCDTFRAVGVLMELDEEIAVNLADIATVRPALLAAIEQDGVPV